MEVRQGMAAESRMETCLLIIFGATGDLTFRKLLPALYQLEKKKELHKGFGVVAVSRKDHTLKEYLQKAKEAVKTHTSEEFQDSIWKRLNKRIQYQSLEFNNEGDYESLRGVLKELDREIGARGNRLFYMATSPKFFGEISKHIQKKDLYSKKRGWKRLMVEKPFGRDLSSARELNEALTEAFKEEEIFRVDHYLMKEMVQNLLMIRAANQIFEPTWNREHIDHVQIISTESEGVGNRGEYYDQAGALRDMVQNHMLQMLALTAVELPGNLIAKNLRKEKIKILQSLIPFKEVSIEDQMVLGQYEGFREEMGVSEKSSTETYAAIRVFLDHPRWLGVPFYLKTGKGLKEKAARIVIQYRLPMGSCCLGETKEIEEPNRLTINIQPQEGVVLSFNTKQPGTLDTILPVSMDFCQNCLIGMNTPEAYEKLLGDAIKGDQTSFTHWEEVEAAWKWSDTLINWARKYPWMIKSYEKGSRGPEDAPDLVNREPGRKWL